MNTWTALSSVFTLPKTLKNIAPLIRTSFIFGATLSVFMLPAYSCDILIDPGHGGSDSGARNNELFEKDLTLSYSKELKNIMVHKYGLDAQISRDSDQFVNLQDRLILASQKQCTSLISLHFNSSLDLPIKGIEIFTPDWPLDFDQGLNFNSNFATHQLFYEIFVYQSHQWGKKLQNQLKLLTPQVKLSKRHLKILSNPERPTLLIELGYLSNPSELNLLKDLTYRGKLLNIVAKTLFENIKGNPPPFGLAHSAPHLLSPAVLSSSHKPSTFLIDENHTKK